MPKPVFAQELDFGAVLEKASKVLLLKVRMRLRNNLRQDFLNVRCSRGPGLFACDGEAHPLKVLTILNHYPGNSGRKIDFKRPWATANLRRSQHTLRVESAGGNASFPKQL
jgi:hypothetical protein